MSSVILVVIYFRQKLESTEKVLEPVPIVGFLTGWFTFPSFVFFLTFYVVPLLLQAEFLIYS